MRDVLLLMSACVCVACLMSVGCVAVPTEPATSSEDVQGNDTAAPPLGFLRADVEAIRKLSGVFDVTYRTQVSPGGLSGGSFATGGAGEQDVRVVTGREAWLVVAEDAKGFVIEQLLLVGDPPAVARLGSQVWERFAGDALTFSQAGGWSLVDDGRRLERDVWRVRVCEPDGRPAYDVVGRWEHDGPGGVSRFVQTGWNARPAGARSAAEVAGAGGWRASSSWRVGPAGWSVTTEGEAFDVTGVTTSAVYKRLGGEASAALLSEAWRWWQQRAGFWSAVRAWWDARLGRGAFTVRSQVDGQPLWQAVLSLGERVVRGELGQGVGLDEAVGEVVSPYVVGRE